MSLKVKILSLFLIIYTQYAISSSIDDKYERFDACVNRCELSQIKCSAVLEVSPNSLIRCELPNDCLERCEKLYLPNN